MKKLFNFIIFFLFFSFAFAERLEKIVIEKGNTIPSEIEYYDNGLIKSFKFNGVSFSNSDTIITANTINGSLKWDIQGTSYFSKFNVTFDDASIHFNSNFFLPKNSKIENDIKIQDTVFSNDDFFLNISQNTFVYKRDNQHWIKKNNTIYDKNSYGQIDKAGIIRPLTRLYKRNNKIVIGKYNCYEYNDGGFTYTRDETISLENTIEKNNIPKLYRFLNFYFISTAMDVSTLPFIFLFDNSDTYKMSNTVVSYDSSSFLSEGNILYSPDNMSSVDGNPWASGNGYGIGDSLFLVVDIFSDFKIAIYNGFQSEKKYLYEQNSRLKTIKVINMDTQESKIYELQDTPDKQELLIQKKNNNENQVGRYKIQILEVYPGTKYKDLCIQAIIPIQNN